MVIKKSDWNMLFSSVLIQFDVCVKVTHIIDIIYIRYKAAL